MERLRLANRERADKENLYEYQISVWKKRKWGCQKKIAKNTNFTMNKGDVGWLSETEQIYNGERRKGVCWLSEDEQVWDEI
jgi:hypothetical protein